MWRSRSEGRRRRRAWRWRRGAAPARRGAERARLRALDARHRLRLPQALGARVGAPHRPAGAGLRAGAVVRAAGAASRGDAEPPHDRARLAPPGRRRGRRARGPQRRARGAPRNPLDYSDVAGSTVKPAFLGRTGRARTRPTRAPPSSMHRRQRARLPAPSRSATLPRRAQPGGGSVAVPRALGRRLSVPAH